MKLTKRNMMPGSLPLIPGWLHNFFETDDVFGPSLINRDIVPAVNVLEDDRSYDIQIAAPGFDRKDFRVTVDGDMLVIAGDRKVEDEKKDGERFTRREFSYSSFTRTFSLPDDVSREGIKAEYKEGILHVRLGRVAEPQRPEPTTIDIH